VIGIITITVPANKLPKKFANDGVMILFDLINIFFIYKVIFSLFLFLTYSKRYYSSLNDCFVEENSFSGVKNSIQ
jgi:hypothetical protein